MVAIWLAIFIILTNQFIFLKQRDLHSDDLNLVQDVVTRWNSSYYMIEHIIQLQHVQPPRATLIETRTDQLTQRSMSTMEIFIVQSS